MAPPMSPDPPVTNATLPVSSIGRMLEGRKEGAAMAHTPHVLLSGLAYVESPRWHDDRLWFAHWGTGEIVAVDLDGRSEVMAEGASGLGWSIDWLPDGRLLVT